MAWPQDNRKIPPMASFEIAHHVAHPVEADQRAEVRGFSL
jgi:hypothetical protein